MIEFKQRAYDGKWVMWKNMIDPTIEPEEYEGMELMMPKIWVPLGVYDYLMEIENV